MYKRAAPEAEICLVALNSVMLDQMVTLWLRQHELIMLGLNNVSQQTHHLYIDFVKALQCTYSTQ